MNFITEWIDKNCYPQYSKNWDDKLFRNVICSNLTWNMTILDLGAGAGIIEAMNFRGQVTRVCGVDLDPRVINNAFLDEGVISNAEEIPYPDSSFDIVFCDNVLEHLDNPLEVFKEIHRVLKPSGLFMFKTPNKWHYIPIIASITPHSFHKFVNRLRGRAETNTFPTIYKSNTKLDIIKLSKESGFSVVKIERLEGRPEYLRINPLTYFAGMLYERIVNLFDMFAPLRILLIGVLQRV